jgi:hypothetical protein
LRALCTARQPYQQSRSLCRNSRGNAGSILEDDLLLIKSRSQPVGAETFDQIRSGVQVIRLPGHQSEVDEVSSTLNLAFSCFSSLEVLVI